MKYKGAQRALPEIARELSVDAILEARHCSWATACASACSWWSARTDETLWSDRYDRSLEDVLGLQSDVAGTVAREIAIQLTPQEATRLSQRRAVNAEAPRGVSEGSTTLRRQPHRKRSS